MGFHLYTLRVYKVPFAGWGGKRKKSECDSPPKYLVPQKHKKIKAEGGQ